MVRRQVREAIKAGLSLTVDWVDGGTLRSSEVDPIDLHGHLLHAYDLDNDEEIETSFLTNRHWKRRYPWN